MPAARIQPDRPSAASLSASQLRRRYVVALSLIAILIIASQVVMQFLIADQEHDSRVINIAGRQRMLSQKITKLAYYVAEAGSADAAAGHRRELEEALRLWQRSHVGLLRGDLEMGLPGRNSNAVVELFGRLQSHHDAIVLAAQAILSSNEGAAALGRRIHDIRDHEADFLKGMNDITFQYDREANAKVAFARWLAIGLMSITLLVLVLEAGLIFAPATRRIERDMQEIADREQDLETLFSVSPTGLLLVGNRNLAILRANQKAADLLGVAAGQLANADLRTYLDVDYEANRHFLDKLSQRETLNECEVVLLDARGSVLQTLVSVRAISFSGEPVFVLGITDISELKRAQQSLEHHATFDEMTGLLNRRTGLMMLGKSMASQRRKGGRLTVGFVDLDGLKVANDNFGHAEGDWLIRTLARVLTGVTRSSDAAVRLGGDEFLLILPDCSLDEAAQLLARGEQRLQEASTAEHKSFPAGFSYGLASYAPEKHSTPDDLIAEADRLMYQAKQQKQRRRADR